MIGDVLSVFDGISCGQVALKKAGVKFGNYYASEIDRYAINITQYNHPGTHQLGDVTKVSGYDFPNVSLYIGGSPCQSFSNVGDGTGFDGKSGLFWEYVRILKELQQVNPKVKFLLENVMMKQAWVDIISKAVGVKPRKINSGRVSGQGRLRLYWTNIAFDKPQSTGIEFESILEPVADIDPKYWLSQREKIYMDREVKGGRTHWDFAHHSDTDNSKTACVVANFCKGVPYNVLIDRRGNRCSMHTCDFQKQKEMCAGCFEEGEFNPHNYQENNDPTSTIRKFTPVECERLQNLPDNYTSAGGKISNSQRYKAIGNGWTVDVIESIFKGLK